MVDGVVANDTGVATAPQSWVERLVGTLLSPRETFDRIHAENTEWLTGFGGAALLVFFVFLLDGLRSASFKDASGVCWSVVFSLFFGYALWLTLALLIWILGSCFGRNKRNVRGATVCLGWTFAPWILMGPLFCYSHATGSFSLVLSLIPGIWIFVLQVIALAVNFELRWTKAIVLAIVAPMVYGFLQLVQFLQALYISSSPFA